MSFSTNQINFWFWKAFDFVPVLLIFWDLQRNQGRATPEDIGLTFAMIMNCVPDMSFHGSFCETKQHNFFHGVPWDWHLQWQMSSGIYGCSSPRKTPLTSHPPHLQRAWEKSRRAASTSTNTEEASPWGTSSREARDSNDQCSISRGAPVVSRTLALAIPVNDVIGLLGADDAECVDGGIRGCKMRVLARAPPKATFWTLTQLQELTYARYTAKWKTKVREHSFQNKFHHSPWLSLKGGKIKPKPLLSTTEHILNIINLWKGPLSPILNAFLSEFCT